MVVGLQGALGDARITVDYNMQLNYGVPPLLGCLCFCRGLLCPGWRKMGPGSCHVHDLVWLPLVVCMVVAAAACRFCSTDDGSRAKNVGERSTMVMSLGISDNSICGLR